MSDISEQIAALSAKKRALLAKLLAKNTGSSDTFPLSYAQERLWFLEQLEPNNPLYTLSYSLRLRGNLHIAALERSLHEIVQRHEVLRATFLEVDGKPVQVVAPELALPLVRESIVATSENEQLLAVYERIRREIWRGFDLTRGPLLRAFLFELGREDHILLLVIHHIVADGWSMGILEHELATYYRAFVRGQDAELPILPLQYVDYAYEQHTSTHIEALQHQLAYWKCQLAELPLSLELPTDYPPPAQPGFQGATYDFMLPTELLTNLKTLGQQHGATLFMTLLAAFQVLLARYTEQDDIAVGTPVANRDRPELEALIGFFVNTLVLRTNLADNPSFSELLQRVRHTALEGYTHQAAPFERVVQAIQPERSLNHTPLFQILFTLQNTPRSDMQLPDLQIQPFEPDSGTAQFTLTLVMRETAGALHGSFEYRTDLFARSTIARMAAHFCQLLQCIVQRPTQPVWDITILTPQELQRILAQPQLHEFAISGSTIIERFEARAEATPDALAIISPTERLTYGELTLHANRLAHLLQQRGARQETCVALMLQRSACLFVALLATLKAGAAYLPLDPASPGERLAFLLNDADPLIILTEQRFSQSLPAGCNISAILIDTPELAENLAQMPATAPTRFLHPEQSAMIIYTSGSTGNPKGVRISQRALATHAASIIAHLQLQEHDRVLHFAALTFDVAAEEIFPSWLAGACVVLWSDRQDLAPADFHHFLLQYQVTVLNLPSSYWQVWLDELERKHWLPPASLRCLIVGSEPTYRQDIIRWLKLVAHRVQHNMNAYGVTEATITSTFQQFKQATETVWQIAPVGQALQNTSTYVLDRRGRVVPIGVSGELYLGGPALSSGYIGQPDVTAERFVPDPFSPLPGARLYRTGDRVRWLSEGCLAYLGRLDQQIKLRGYRVEPGEIEAALAHLSNVRETAVKLWQETAGGPQIVAYVALNDEGQGERALVDMRSTLSLRLPDYMLPASIVALPELPRLPSGKVAYQELPEPKQEFVSSDEPCTELERIIARVWSEILENKAIGIYTNFFVLGGHSLLATRVISRLRDELQQNIPLRLLFEAPTIAQLASALSRDTAKQSEERILRQSRTKRLFPLSFAQRRLWFLDQFQPGSPLYNIPSVLHLQGVLHLAALHRALNVLVARHETLRTLFISLNGEPEQVVLEHLDLPLPLIDLRQIAEAARFPEAQRLVNADVCMPFDLERGPLVRASLFQLAEDEYILLLNLHHIIYDGWSTQILFRDLNTCYTAFSREQTPDLPALPLQYVDFACWQLNYMQGAAYAREIDYWKKQLAAVPMLQLPTDRPRPAVQTHQGAVVSSLVPQWLREALQQLSLQYNCTLYMTLLAAFVTLLYRYTGQADLTVGTPIAGRNRTEVESMLGFFVNTLVVRSRITEGLSFRELLSQIRQTSLEAYAHQDLPFEQLVEILQPERNLSTSPLFQVFFALQNVEQTPLILPDLNVTAIEADNHASKFDLSLFVGETEEGLALEAEYAVDLFERTSIVRLLSHFEELLKGIVVNPEQALISLPLLTKDEQRQLLVTLNTTRADFADQSSLPELVMQQARCSPQASAVVFGQTTLTYAELEMRSNQLAQYLYSLGVRHGTLVGLCLERSPDMVVSLLGILKAGGAYVPLDPSYPQERITFVLQDACIPFVLTQRHLMPLLTGTNARCVLLEEEQDQIDLMAGTYLAHQSPPTAEQLAYVIYTSGSTGKPKGVQIPHRAIVNFLQTMARKPGLTAADSLLAVTPISFDIAGLELYLPLIVGARLLLASKQEASEGERLLALLCSSQTTVMQATPATWRLLIEAGWTSQMTPGLKILCGGESLPYELAQQILSNSSELWNMYGPTETTIWSAISKVEIDDPHISLGYPIANTELYILDSACNLLPPGVPGELYIGGEGLSWGYLQRPELTAEKFVPHPFSQQPGARLYRSGDRVRYRADGSIEFLGRIDYQVKVRGFRIEPGEIEVLLGQHQEVREIVVVVRENTSGDKRLVAYFVQRSATSRPLQSEQTNTLVAELRNHLKQYLPDYMIPSSFVMLDTLPLTPNGKVNRQALPEPETMLNASDVSYVAPRTPQEQLLATIWGEVLGLERVGIQDNFFEIGGDSLLVIRVVARARQAHMSITTRQVFQHQTIEKLAEVADTVQILAEQGIVTGPVAFTPAQYQFFETEAQHLERYSIAFLLEAPLDQPVKKELLQQTSSTLLRHHDSLRLQLHRQQSGEGWFLVNAGEEVQIVVKSYDFSCLSPVEQQQAIRATITDLQVSFDLRQGPLMQVALFERGRDYPQQVLVVCHYLAADLMSWQILLTDFDRAYQQIQQGQAIKFLPKTTAFKQWTDRLSEYVRSTPVQKEIDYWLDESWKRVQPLPVDFPMGENTIGSAATISLTLSHTETRVLVNDIAKMCAVQIDEILLMGIFAGFSAWSSYDHLLINLIGHGREALFDDIDLTRTVGWLNTDFPIRLFGERENLIGSVKLLQTISAHLRAIPHHGIGYGVLRYLSPDPAIRQRLREFPQAEVYFNYQGDYQQDVTHFTAVGGFGGYHHDTQGGRGHLIGVVGSLVDGQLQLKWEYSQNMHRRETVEALVQQVADTLRALGQDFQQNYKER